MEYRIKVRSETKWGKQRFYPACRNAELFCEIARPKATALTARDIENIKALGFEVEATQEVATRHRKLSPEAREVIRQDPRSERTIAAEYGLARSTVHAIKSKKP